MVTDREKVIKAFQKWCDEQDENCPVVCVTALKLLKEQEAVEPTLIREGRNKYYNDYVCPGCDNELHYGQNYCSECGRAVKWE